MTNQEQDRLPDILEKVSELARKASGDDYLYRGEPQRYNEVSSSLFREYPDIEAERFNIEVVQQEILDEAKRFTRETNDDFILEQLQHFGYPTNQIDFTKDYLIALFFACDGHPEEDGRVILLSKAGRDDLKEPKTPANRVISQKSVFVRPSSGFIEAEDAVVIPKTLKRPILEYLDKNHGVNAPALFNDIHGFIKYYTVHRSAYVDFHTGLTYGRKKEYSKAIEHFSKAIERNPQMFPAYVNRGIAYRFMGNYISAIRDHEKAIELNPNSPQAYNSKGVTYRQQGRYELAIQDFTKAIELNSDYGTAYGNRGLSSLFLGDWGNGESDLSRAQSLGFNIVSAFSREFGGVADFERNFKVQFPENIMKMLTHEQ